MDQLINFDYNQTEPTIIKINDDININRQNQHLFPINIGYHNIDFNNHQITIEDCIDWKGVFVLQGGQISNIKLNFKNSNQLYNDKDNNIFGAILVYSDLQNSTYGKISNIEGIIETQEKLYGIIVGNYACTNHCNHIKKYELTIENIYLKITAKVINGCIIGPYCAYGSKLMGFKFNFHNIILNIKTDIFYGLLIGDYFGQKSESTYGSILYSNLIYKIIGKTIINDEISKNNNYIFGNNREPSLRVSIIMPIVTNQKNYIDHSILKI